MSEDVQIVPFMGHLTGEHIRLAIQARLEQDYFQIAHALAPEPFMRHAALSSAVAGLREREQNGR